jgi:hypothetical protein
MNSYARVAEILEAATGDGQPSHQGRRRFWTLPLDQFMMIGTIRDVQLIADPGPDRGARSGLIQALRGEGRFTDDGFGRMPLDREPVADFDIQYIQDWIDEGCPE